MWRRALSRIGRRQRAFSTQSGPTGIVMLNMGGPSSIDGKDDGVEPFLTNLFTDREIIQLGPLQPWLGPFIAKRRTPKIQAQYRAIGGKSPIREWTELQGAEMAKKLDKLSPQSAPHKSYTAFRYAPPLSEEALRAMERDGVRRAVAFSQYPHFSCTTSGSSFNHLWRELRRLGMEDTFRWSVIDRWPTHPTYIRALTKRVEMGLSQFTQEERERVVVVFTAHSLPMMVVKRGDPYAFEVAATAQLVAEALRPRVRHILAWQSKVGYLPWLEPSTSNVLKDLGRAGHDCVLAVPVAFTSDHIETLYEVDVEYRKEAEEAGVKKFVRAPSLNDEDLLTTAQAELVAEHLKSGELHSVQYPLKCPGCPHGYCRTVPNPAQ